MRMNKWEKRAVMVGLGFITWSIIFSIISRSLTPFIPIPSGGFTGGGAEMAGFIFGWLVFCWMLGWPLFLMFGFIYDHSEKFKRLVEKLK